MNTTITINLAGMAFYIDENACNVLRSYLQSIEKNLSSDTDKKEVMRDIEARIAEIFSDMRRREHVEVISIDMVRAVMDQLGKPDDFREETTEEPSTVDSLKQVFHRKIYRDSSNQLIGGVCSGLGYWMGINAIWVRLVFLLCLLIWGITLPIYIILWIIMPEAKTAAQRLDMRGEEPTVENIQKEIEIQKANPSNGNGGCLLTLLKIFVWCVGGFFLFIALIILFAVTMGLVGALSGLAAASPIGMLGLLFSGNGWLVTLFIILVLIVVGLPIVGIIYAIVKFFRKGEHASPKTLWIAFFIWLAAVAGSIGIGIHELIHNEEISSALQSLDYPERLFYDEDDENNVQTALEVEPFHSISISGVSNVRLSQADEQYVTANNLDDLTVEVHDSVLCISTGKEGADLWIQAPEIRAIALNGTARLRTNDMLTTDNLKIGTQGASRLSLKAQVQSLDLSCSGASDIELEGQADNFDIHVSGASEVDAENLNVRIAKMAVSGASKVEINVSDTLDVHASGFSKIVYSGDPYVSSAVSGGSKIKRTK